jgi:hypothetical protein
MKLICVLFFWLFFVGCSKNSVTSPIDTAAIVSIQAGQDVKNLTVYKNGDSSAVIKKYIEKNKQFDTTIFCKIGDTLKFSARYHSNLVLEYSGNFVILCDRTIFIQ